ncbi:MAG: hypothetical protein EB127_02560 [Alphaproteobacteria bacterium]|nr:hypothetical protein [Alphaproteobacteria bacterium]
MRLLAIALVSAALSSCSIWQQFNLKPKWPEASSEESLRPCEDLKRFENKNADGSVDLIEFQRLIVENYVLHYKCSDKNDNWIDWYKQQKQIYESGGKK